LPCAAQVVGVHTQLVQTPIGTGFFIHARMSLSGRMRTSGFVSAYRTKSSMMRRRSVVFGTPGALPSQLDAYTCVCATRMSGARLPKRRRSSVYFSVASASALVILASNSMVMSMPTIFPVDCSKKFGLGAPPSWFCTRCRNPAGNPYWVASESSGTKTAETGSSHSPGCAPTEATLRPLHLLRMASASALPDSIEYGHGQLAPVSPVAQQPVMLES
jgi:hypothetical protein